MTGGRDKILPIPPFLKEGDLTEKFKQIAAQNNQDLQVVSNYYQQNVNARENLAAQLREDKVVELLFSKAQITEVDRSEI